jgi:hypothetical protein
MDPADVIARIVKARTAFRAEEAWVRGMKGEEAKFPTVPAAPRPLPVAASRHAKAGAGAGAGAEAVREPGDGAVAEENKAKAEVAAEKKAKRAAAKKVRAATRLEDEARLAGRRAALRQALEQVLLANARTSKVRAAALEQVRAWTRRVAEEKQAVEDAVRPDELARLLEVLVRVSLDVAAETWSDATLTQAGDPGGGADGARSRAKKARAEPTGK